MPLPVLMNEGQQIDHLGNMVWPIYVDFRVPADRQPINRLVKGCQAQYAMEAIGQIRLSKPSKFREFGENLIRDCHEARPRRSAVTVNLETIDESRDLQQARLRDQSMNRVSQLVGAGLNRKTTSVRRTYSEGESKELEAGKNALIFCTSIEPSTPNERQQWHDALDDDYDHVSYVYSSRTFARELGSVAAEHLGPLGQVGSMTSSFEGMPTLTTHHPMQPIFHGPVIYVDDAYGLVEAATTKFELMLLPLFAKEKRFEALREYRFVVWTEAEPAGLFEDLPISPGMAGTIGEGSGRIIPLWMPESAEVMAELASTEIDAGNQDDTGSGLDRDCDSGLGHRLLEANSLETELFRKFSRASNPATVYQPQKISSDDLPEDFQSLTATYSGVEALHRKVCAFLKNDEEPSDRKLGATSAAWYAEQDIRSLCQEFDEPISGVSIDQDGYILIQIALSDWPELKGKLAVSPTGESVLRLVAPRRHFILPREQRLPDRDIAKVVREFVNQLAKNSRTL